MTFYDSFLYWKRPLCKVHNWYLKFKRSDACELVVEDMGQKIAKLLRRKNRRRVSPAVQGFPQPPRHEQPTVAPRDHITRTRRGHPCPSNTTPLHHPSRNEATEPPIGHPGDSLPPPAPSRRISLAQLACKHDVYDPSPHLPEILNRHDLPPPRPKFKLSKILSRASSSSGPVGKASSKIITTDTNLARAESDRTAERTSSPQLMRNHSSLVNTNPGGPSFLLESQSLPFSQLNWERDSEMFCPDIIENAEQKRNSSRLQSVARGVRSVEREGREGERQLYQRSRLARARTAEFSQQGRETEHTSAPAPSAQRDKHSSVVTNVGSSAKLDKITERVDTGNNVDLNKNPMNETPNKDSGDRVTKLSTIPEGKLLDSTDVDRLVSELSRNIRVPGKKLGRRSPQQHKVGNQTPVYDIEHDCFIGMFGTSVRYRTTFVWCRAPYHPFGTNYRFRKSVLVTSDNTNLVLSLRQN